MIVRTLLTLLLALAAPFALAHKPSDSYLTLTADDAAIEGRWDIALRDLDHAIGLDADGDGAITWGEVRRRHADIAAYALARLQLSRAGQPCTLTTGEQLIDNHTDGAYTVLPLAVNCPAPTGELSVRYTLFAELDPQHRGLFRLDAGGGTQTAVLDPQQPEQRFTPAAPDRWKTFRQFLVEGVWHIWIGLDHILFLLSLLLPAVLVWRKPNWQPAQDFRTGLVDVVKIVTSFTVAHSITLSLAALGVIQLPSALVESAIAASVVLAALNNVFPLVQGSRWVVAFGFGLIHGFGFASVLAELELPRGALLLALVSFNLGVELGQLAIVLLFLPIAHALRATLVYRRVVMLGGSLAIALLAAGWFVERAFGVTWPVA